MLSRSLELLAQFFALIGGLMITLVAALTCMSVASREFAGWSLAGDFELSAAAAGVAAALFVPMCYLRGGHISVDAFTTWATPAQQGWMDRLGSLALALVAALLAWRTTVGGLSAYASQSASMLLGLPEWIVYAGMAPPMALTAALALIHGPRGRHA